VGNSDKSVFVETVAEPKRHSMVDFIVRLVKEKPLGTIGAIIVILLFLTGIFAPLLAPYGMSEINLADRLVPPSGQYVLGTDQLGRDLLTRVIYGARISMIVGLAGSFLSVGISVIIGTITGLLGGKVDIIVQRFVDAWMCFPGLLILITLISLVGPGLLQVIVVIGMLYGINGSRVIRSAVIGIKENLYVDAAVAIGCTTGKLLTQHILPNVMAPIIVLFSTRLGTVILVEAMMSFLGYGIPPPIPSWGGMLSGDGRKYMLDAPWLALWPGLALSIVVYGVNMFGDALRDILDPKLRGGVGHYGTVKKKSKAKA